MPPCLGSYCELNINGHNIGSWLGTVPLNTNACSKVWSCEYTSMQWWYLCQLGGLVGMAIESGLSLHTRMVAEYLLYTRNRLSKFVNSAYLQHFDGVKSVSLNAFLYLAEMTLQMMGLMVELRQRKTPVMYIRFSLDTQQVSSEIKSNLAITRGVSWSQTWTKVSHNFETTLVRSLLLDRAIVK